MAEACTNGRAGAMIIAVAVSNATGNAARAGGISRYACVKELQVATTAVSVCDAAAPQNLLQSQTDRTVEFNFDLQISL